jgi:FkbM family methyltransferase
MLLDIYEPLVAAIIRKYVRAGSAAIDAGAHLGYFTLKIARAVGCAGSVHAFECDPRLVSRLAEHVRLNNTPWVKIHTSALGDGRGETTVLHLPDQLGWATTKQGHWVRPCNSITVPALSLDEQMRRQSLAPKTISFIKVDVEGAELETLQGARRMLAESDAAVLVEFLPERIRAVGQEPAEILDLMADHQYQAWVPKLVGRSVSMDPATPESSGDVLFLK